MANQPENETQPPHGLPDDAAYDAVRDKVMGEVVSAMQSGGRDFVMPTQAEIDERIAQELLNQPPAEPARPPERTEPEPAAEEVSEPIVNEITEPDPSAEPEAVRADPVAEIEPEPDPVADAMPAAPVTDVEPDTITAPLPRFRLPPRLLTLPWKIGYAVAALAAVAVMGNCLFAYANVPSPTPPEPTPAPAPTPALVAALNPARPTSTPLPSQYAFVHFVNEMTACYQQRGFEADAGQVEADIMQDVPLAINELLKLYAQEECTEIVPWYRIPGRVGWLLRGSGMDVS